jgi:hypothetical protein
LVDILYAVAATNLRARKHIWGNVVPLLLGYFIERDPYSRDYHLHSGSNLLNELTNYGKFDLFGGCDLQQFMLVCLVASDSHLYAMVILILGFSPSYFRE